MASVEEIGRGIYHWSCVNCGGSNTESRLLRMLPCDKCLPLGALEKILSYDAINLENLHKTLSSLGTLSNVAELYRLDREVQAISEFFERCVGSPPWGAQKAWIKRFIRGDSFSIVAPTGMGKTTFGLVLALYLACSRGEKTYIIAPTVTLVAQLADKVLSMSKAVNCHDRVKVLYLYGKMRKDLRREAEKRIEEGDFHILITTIAFARKNLEALSRNRFKLIFVDDVDAVMKSGRSIEAVLKIAGFTSEDIENAHKLLQIERELARLSGTIPEKSSEKYKERLRRINELQADRERLRNLILEKRRNASTLIVSSATGRPRGAKVRVFRALLGFEVGGRSDIGLRNVVDAFLIPSGDLISEAIEVIKRLGKGTLVFVPNDWGVDKAEELASKLREAGVNSHAYHGKTPFEVFLRFQQGEIDVLVGIANYYGPLVRGIDLPEVVRHAVFVGVPRHKFPLNVEELDPHPSSLARIVSILAELDIPGVSQEARRVLGELRRILRRYSQGYLSFIRDKIKAGQVDETDKVSKAILKAIDFVREALRNPDVIKSINEKSDIGVIEENGKIYILIADVPTYLQASGRTSRLYAGGITKGLSVVIVDNANVMRRLITRSKYVADVNWIDFRSPDFNLDRLLKEIEDDRRKVSEILRKLMPSEKRELVKTSLLIVESPNKARTIASFFGRPSIRLLPGGLRAYEISLHNHILIVAASGGHIYDLVPEASSADLEIANRYLDKTVDLFGVIVGERDGSRTFVPVYSSIKRCLICGEQYVEDTTYCPRCGSRSIKDSRSIVEDLRRLAWEADVVYIATDPDTEGEKIGWDLAVLLRPVNRNIKRLEFHEVTRPAILQALQNPRDFNERLVEAQIVRRVEDRWIGFTLSPLLWCDFWPNYYCAQIESEARKSRECSIEYNYNLSAGRVQTPTLGWIVERMSNIRKIDLFILSRIESNEVVLTLREDEIPSPHVVKSLRECASDAMKEEKLLCELKVSLKSKEWITIPPPPPFTTDTLILEANKRLGLGAPEVMRVAQDLFEWGLITYHRTDSTRVSERGMEIALDWLKQAYGELSTELYKPRRWSEKGAHEAIRPVRPIDSNTLNQLIEEGLLDIPGDMTLKHYKVYDLIFRRFIASQMREAEVLRSTYIVDIAGAMIEISRIIDYPRDQVKAGFLNVLPEALPLQRPLLTAEEEEDLLSGRKKFSPVRCYVTRRKISSLMPYTQGEIVEEMKKRGIGRPSTYAKIVETLLKRGYVVTLKKPKGGYIVTTKKGKLVYHYLTRDILSPRIYDEYGDSANYLAIVPKLVSEERTRQLEELMDMIERGERNWVNVMEEIYNEIAGLAHTIRFATTTSETGPGISMKLAHCLSMRDQIVKRGRES